MQRELKLEVIETSDKEDDRDQTRIFDDREEERSPQSESEDEDLIEPVDSEAYYFRLFPFISHTSLSDSSEEDSPEDDDIPDLLSSDNNSDSDEDCDSFQNWASEIQLSTATHHNDNQVLINPIRSVNSTTNQEKSCLNKIEILEPSVKEISFKKELLFS